MKNISLVIILLLISLSACAQPYESSVKANSVDKSSYTTELIMKEASIPWGMAFLPDQSLLVTDKNGKMYHYSKGSVQEIKGVPEVYVTGQGGLLDVEIHPNFKENSWVYLTYSSQSGEGEGSNTALLRAKLVNNTLTDKKVLYKASPNSSKGHHFGSRIEFDDKGYLYFTIGDRGDRDINPQDLAKDGGKVYRLHDDGSIPTDNPFISESGAKKAIYSYGHRNPQGLIKNPYTGEIWEHEHGPKGGDEINIIKPGKNYGWPVISYGINYDGTTFTDITAREGMVQPLFYWVPSIAPCGMTFVTSDKYPNWKGNLLVGSLSIQYLERLVLQNNKVVKRERLLDKMGRIRNVLQGPDGYIYVAVEGKGILKLIPKK
ncbi:MAG: PQQ-dependent sugar dehydrogenase [Flavobacteriaceae bacterium]|jgi:glucose/arabinose dehydrogenase|nr:PQQ-dependent sugar dehydrogenase [Flavobacteriaceae bacterium]MCB0485665.1 PQQ-dependent sugar dehydrogenase [Flavobacteriaceae bacterium]